MKNLTRKDLVKATGATENQVKVFMRKIRSSSQWTRMDIDIFLLYAMMFMVYRRFGSKMFDTISKKTIEKASKKKWSEYDQLIIKMDGDRFSDRIDSEKSSVKGCGQMVVVDIYDVITKVNENMNMIYNGGHKNIEQTAISIVNDSPLTDKEMRIIRLLRESNGEFVVNTKDGDVVSIKKTVHQELQEW